MKFNTKTVLWNCENYTIKVIYRLYDKYIIDKKKEKDYKKEKISRRYYKAQ